MTLTQNSTLIHNLTLAQNSTLAQIDFADKGFIIKTLFLWDFLVITSKDEILIQKTLTALHKKTG